MTETDERDRYYKKQYGMNDDEFKSYKIRMSDGLSEEEHALKASKAMFDLNRFCKYPRCSRNNRSLIYELKSQLLYKLYEKGFVTSSRFIPYNMGFWLLRFVIEGVTFTWHVPNNELFDFKEFNKDELGNDDDVSQELKPFNCPKSKVNELKKIVNSYIIY